MVRASAIAAPAVKTASTSASGINFFILSSLSRQSLFGLERVYVALGWSLCSAENGMLHCSNNVCRRRNPSSFRNNRLANRAALIRATALNMPLYVAEFQFRYNNRQIRDGRSSFLVVPGFRWRSIRATAFAKLGRGSRCENGSVYPPPHAVRGEGDRAQTRWREHADSRFFLWRRSQLDCRAPLPARFARHLPRFAGEDERAHVASQ
jgi:hypothetical protein